MYDVDIIVEYVPRYLISKGMGYVADLPCAMSPIISQSATADAGPTLPDRGSG